MIIARSALDTRITVTFHSQLLDKGAPYTGIGGNLVSIVFTCLLFIFSATPSLVVQLLQRRTLGVTTGPTESLRFTRLRGGENSFIIIVFNSVYFGHD